MPCNNQEDQMTDYQTDYKMMYEDLRSMVRLYFEIKMDDGTIYHDDDYQDALDQTELELCVMVGLIDEDALDG